MEVSKRLWYSRRWGCQQNMVLQDMAELRRECYSGDGGVQGTVLLRRLWCPGDNSAQKTMVSRRECCIADIGLQDCLQETAVLQEAVCQEGSGPPGEGSVQETCGAPGHGGASADSAAPGEGSVQETVLSKRKAVVLRRQWGPGDSGDQ